MRFEWPEFGRCCFCMPLRRGILTFGYISLVYHLLVIIAASVAVHKNYGRRSGLVSLSGVMTITMEADITLGFMLLDTIFVALLLYGAHVKVTTYIKIFFYYGVTTTVAAVLLQLIQTFLSPYWYYELEFLIFTFAGLVIQVYLLCMIRSLLTKLERYGPHHYENQLNQIITNGDAKSNNDAATEDYNPTIETNNYGAEDW